MKTGYIVFRDGKVFIADSPEPDIRDYTHYCDQGKYEIDTQAFQDSQVKAVNAEVADEENPNIIIAITGLDEENVWLCGEGQKVQHIDGKIIALK